MNSRNLNRAIFVYEPKEIHLTIVVSWKLLQSPLIIKATHVAIAEQDLT